MGQRRVPPSSTTRRRLLLAIAPLLLILEIPGAIELWNRPFHGMNLNNDTVQTVDVPSPAASAGVRAGDVLLSLDGRPTLHDAAFRAALFGARAGRSVALEIGRDGTAVTLTLTLAQKPLGRRVLDFFQSAIGLCFLFLGFVTYLRRHDALGRHFYACCLLFAYQLLDLPTFPWTWLMLAIFTVRDVLALFLSAELLRFCLIFPEGVEERRPELRRRRWLMLPPLLVAPLHIWANFSVARPATSPLVRVVGLATAVLFAGYVVAALIVFTRKVLRREPWVLWTKLRLAALGLAVGALPIALAAVARQVWPAAPVPLEKVAVLLLPLVPASFSVALLRTRAIDLSDLLRQGLITLALTLLLVPPAAAFLMVAGPLLSGAGRGLGYLLTVLAVFALSVSAVPARRRIGTAIDHLLYPEQQTQRARAQSLAAALNQQRDPQQLAQLLCADLLSLFHGSSAALYACDAEAMQLQAQSGTVSERPHPVRVAREASLLAEVFRSSEMILVEPMLTGPRPVHLDEESRKLLATGCALLCPLAAGGRPVGLLAMGPPRGGGMFGTFELHEIRMLAGHTAAALENAILHREDLARERLAAEMALAREIQAHLMPASDLAAGPFTVSGKMISSAQVGGDVFDHFTLGDGRVVMAVADASGKGVPASLLMSSMRPAIREAMQPGSTLVQAVARLNRHVHAMTSERHFIALFLAALEPTTHVMTYVVAGLDPPLWVRARLGRVEQLTRGGPVLGIDLTAGFREGVIRLLPGDVLLAYTDGMIDQENATGEPFGTARLSAWTRRLKDLPAAEIRAGLFAAVEEFGPGPAADDKTLLVLKFDAPAQAGTEAAEASAGA